MDIKTKKKDAINNNKAMMKAKFIDYIAKGRKKITTYDELKHFPKGSIICLVGKDKVCHSYGFLRSVHKSYFKAYFDLLGDCNVYKIPFDYVDKMYVGNVYETVNDYVSIKATTKPVTGFPAKLGDIVVYYAKDNMDRNRFISTEKYERMAKWFEIFGYSENEDKE